ncbi:MAG: thiamine pyrophosphate-dependent enzyme [Phreatobacter sp.]|jgi:thiamine pyrophosphate-dependent acetolactate synthase large subunit-like protein|uniref:thiamine pyrophosphate-dependent enzyme n=1 Tax=Phreatobacter sp. TaxID=1966341 RepID=UPI0027338197|nr:thiamine pyrophosphate-dependent enzyme [Phreatobacter sp.]MDP2801399.1 thiamine pyrophosphate-dependent enzyme [Phreatobacter sp.]
MSQSVNRLDRRAVVARLLKDRGEAIVVTGLGSPTYDVAACGDHDRNVYLWGAMGGCAVMALGIALARPETPVIAVTGDGEMLMGVGSFATIAMQAPKNLTVVILDNGLYGETGGQASHTLVADLAGIAGASGIADSRAIDAMGDVEGLATRATALGNGPCVAVVRIGQAELERVLPTRDGHAVRARVRQSLGLSID